MSKGLRLCPAVLILDTNGSVIPNERMSKVEAALKKFNLTPQSAAGSKLLIT